MRSFKLIDTTFFSHSDVGDCKIESPTKIILKVGDSTITMTPDNITIKATRVDINP